MQRPVFRVRCGLRSQAAEEIRESLLARKLGGAHKAAAPVAHKACQTEALDEPVREPPPMPPLAEDVSVYRTHRDVSACAVVGWGFVNGVL